MKKILGMVIILLLAWNSAALAGPRLPNLVGTWGGTVTTISGDSTQNDTVTLTVERQSGALFLGQIHYYGSVYDVPISGVITANGDFQISSGFLLTGTSQSFLVKTDGAGKLYKYLRAQARKLKGTWTSITYIIGTGGVDASAATFELDEQIVP